MIDLLTELQNFARVQRQSDGSATYVSDLVDRAVNEIQHHRAEREAMQEMFPARPGILREALERKAERNEDQT